jgi:hypothetical protein
MDMFFEMYNVSKITWGNRKLNDFMFTKDFESTIISVPQ